MPILEAEPLLAMGSFLVKVGLQGATAADVARPAVEAASQRIGVANVHFDCRNAQLFKHLLNRCLIGIHHHTFLIQH